MLKSCISNAPEERPWNREPSASVASTRSISSQTLSHLQHYTKGSFEASTLQSMDEFLNINHKNTNEIESPKSIQDGRKHEAKYESHVRVQLL